MNIKIQKWLYSKKNLAGCASASLAIILYLMGVIDIFAWLIIAGFYAAGYLIAPKDITTVFFHTAGETLADYKGFLDRLVKNSRESLPMDAQLKLDNIRTNSHELLDFLAKSPEHLHSFSTHIHSVKKIFDQYLPQLINRYVKLPKRYAQSVRLANEKTSQDMLMEQLTILDEQITKISHAIYENDTRALQVHGKVLEQKFEHEDYL